MNYQQRTHVPRRVTFWGMLLTILAVGAVAAGLYVWTDNLLVAVALTAGFGIGFVATSVFDPMNMPKDDMTQTPPCDHCGKPVNGSVRGLDGVVRPLARHTDCDPNAPKDLFVNAYAKD